MNQKSVMFATILVFLNKGFKFQTYVCNECHDLLMMSTNLDDIATLNIRDVDYRYIISRISESDAVNLLQNTDLVKKSRTSSNTNFLTAYKNG